MYAMMTPVQAGTVHFETPNLALPAIRELTEFEIDWVAGGLDIDYRQVLRAATVSATIGGISVGAGGAVAGAIFGPGAVVGFAGGFVSGAVGGFVGGALFNIAEQTGIL